MSINLATGGQTYHTCVEALQKATELRIIECAEVAEKHRRWLRETVLRTTRLLQSHCGDAVSSASIPQDLPSSRDTARGSMALPAQPSREAEVTGSGILSVPGIWDDKENDAFAGNDASRDMQPKVPEGVTLIKAEDNEKEIDYLKLSKAGLSSRFSDAKRNDVTSCVQDAKAEDSGRNPGSGVPSFEILADDAPAVCPQVQDESAPALGGNATDPPAADSGQEHGVNALNQTAVPAAKSAKTRNGRRVGAKSACSTQIEVAASTEGPGLAATSCAGGILSSPAQEEPAVAENPVAAGRQRKRKGLAQNSDAAASKRASMEEHAQGGALGQGTAFEVANIAAVAPDQEPTITAPLLATAVKDADGGVSASAGTLPVIRAAEPSPACPETGAGGRPKRSKAAAPKPPVSTRSTRGTRGKAAANTEAAGAVAVTMVTPAANAATSVEASEKGNHLLDVVVDTEDKPSETKPVRGGRGARGGKPAGQRADAVVTSNGSESSIAPGQPAGEPEVAVHQGSGMLEAVALPVTEGGDASADQVLGVPTRDGTTLAKGHECVPGVHAEAACPATQVQAHILQSFTATTPAGSPAGVAASSPAVAVSGPEAEAAPATKGTGRKGGRKGRKGVVASMKAEVADGTADGQVPAATPDQTERHIDVPLTDERMPCEAAGTAVGRSDGHATPCTSLPPSAAVAKHAARSSTPAVVSREPVGDRLMLAAPLAPQPAAAATAPRSLRSASRDSGASTVASSVETPRFAWAAAIRPSAAGASPSLGVDAKEDALPLVVVAAPVLPQSVPRSLRGRASRGAAAATPPLAPALGTPVVAASRRMVTVSPPHAPTTSKRGALEAVVVNAEVPAEALDEEMACLAPGISLDDSMELDSANGDEGHNKHDDLVHEEGHDESHSLVRGTGVEGCYSAGHDDVGGAHAGGSGPQDAPMEECEGDSEGGTLAPESCKQAASIVAGHRAQADAGVECALPQGLVAVGTPLQPPLPAVVQEASVGRMTRSGSRGAVTKVEPEAERTWGSAVRGGVRLRGSSSSSSNHRQEHALGSSSSPLTSAPLVDQKSPVATHPAMAPVLMSPATQAMASMGKPQRTVSLEQRVAADSLEASREAKGSMGGNEVAIQGLAAALSPQATHMVQKPRASASTNGSDGQKQARTNAVTEAKMLSQASPEAVQVCELAGEVVAASGAGPGLLAHSPALHMPARKEEARDSAAAQGQEVEDDQPTAAMERLQQPDGGEKEGASRGSSLGEQVSDSEGEGKEDYGSEASLRESMDGRAPGEIHAGQQQQAAAPVGGSLRSNLVSAIRSFIPFVNRAPASVEPPAAGNRKNLRVPALERAAAAKAKDEERAARKRERAALLEQRKVAAAVAGAAAAGASASSAEPHDKPKEGGAAASAAAAVLPVHKKGPAGPSAVELKLKRAVETRSRLEEEERRAKEEEIKRKEEEWQKKKAEAEAKRKAKEEADRREAEDKRRRAEEVKASRRAEEEGKRAEMEAREEERRRKAAAAEEEARRLKAKRDAAEAHYGASAAACKRKPEAAPAPAEGLQQPRLKKNKEGGHAPSAGQSEDVVAAGKSSALSPEGGKERVIVIDPPPAPSRVPGAHSNPMMPPPPAKPVTSPPVSSPSVRKDGADASMAAAVPCALQDVGAMSFAMAAGGSSSAPAESVESYVISPYKEDSDSDSDVEGTEPKKVYPLWARTTALWPALQAQERVDPDNIFKAPETCQLEEVFDKCHYNRKEKFRNRGSSGNWFGDHLRWQDELAYKKAMGYL